ncbi:hypothetical protein GCM10023196_086070 [Actinoallomurus vinaceus]|uniref:Major facilitator superfamily (MFS) profile domain-containing protein n=1 Tax=Actinoallomurus vinaceus TaxID=1080074 RepID=A0ABP8UR87_9ACTN
MSFVLVLSEFLPIGLLPVISSSLGVSIGTVGLVVVVPGLMAAVTAPLVTMASGRLDRRRVLIALALATLAVKLPALPPTGAIRLATLTSALRNPAARVALLIFFGHFAAYTYVTPYLEEQAHFGSSTVTAVLLAYGLAGLAGNFAAGAVIGRRLRAVYVAAAVLVQPPAESLVDGPSTSLHGPDGNVKQRTFNWGQAKHCGRSRDVACVVTLNVTVGDVRRG